VHIDNLCAAISPRTTPDYDDHRRKSDMTDTQMPWTLEVVVVPVTDIDRAKEFYADQIGFAVDHDTKISDEVRIVQLTPPGSGCSIVIGEGAVPDMAPGSLKGLQLVVPDIAAARAQLVDAGVDVTAIQVLGESPRKMPHPLDNVGFCFFNDPDGNGWAIQQISTRSAAMESEN
jgi:catechol 2,3-dioxygenase-like lactoylglutathione lyase family enzyme